MSTIVSDLVSHLQCGVAIAANDAVYINSADGKIYKYDPLQPLQVYAGIAKEAGLLNAFIRVVQSGRVKGFTGLTPGAFVYASVTVPGGFQLTDPGSSLKVVLGIAKSATELTVNGALGIKTGGGTGSGGINYILNPDADTTVGWATYADAGGVTPVDGTGGSPTVTLTRSTSSPLRGTASFLYTKPASNVQGQGFSYDFTIDSADTGKVLQGSFDYQIASGTFADDAMSVWIYDVTNARMIQPAPYLLKNSGIIERFPFEFQTSIDSTSYRLIVHQSSTSAVACTIKFDNFKVGPTAKAYGSAVTDWVNITPPPITGTGGGGGTLNIGTGGGAQYTVQFKRIGDEALLKYNLRIGTSGATDVTGIWVFNLPVNMPSLANGYESLGYGDITVAASASPVARLIPKAYSGGFLVDVNDTANLGAGGLAFNNNNVVNITVRYKVAGWSSSQIMSSDADTRVVAASVSTTTGSIANGGAPQALTIAITNLDTHGAWNGTTAYTVKVPGIYNINIDTSFNTSITGLVITYYKINSGAVVPLAFSANPIQYSSFAAQTDIPLVAGDVITFYVSQTSAGSISINLARALIKRLSGPVSIAASESVSALYTGAPPTGTLNGTPNVVTFGTRVKDSHNAYSGGSYLIPMSGVYNIATQVKMLGTYTLGQVQTLYIYVDGVAVHATTTQAGGSMIEQVCTLTLNSIPLLTGQVVTIRASSNGTSPTYASSILNFFSLSRSGNY